MNYAEIEHVLNQKLPSGIYYSFAKQSYIFSGHKNVDLHYNRVQQIAETNKISYYPLQSVAGGTIVISPGDLFIAGINYQGNWYTTIQSLIITFFKQKQINCYFKFNDFIIDNDKKIGSVFYGTIKDTNIYGIWINSHINNELIQKVCFHGHDKHPYGLDSYNISTLEILDFIKKELA